MNVNLQMNYWPTYVTNMAECAEPLINYIDASALAIATLCFIPPES